jgi:hypothetical protein
VVFNYVSFQRRVLVDGCASRPVATVTAIPAGSKWCCQILKAMLIQPLERVMSWCPGLRMKVWVDDLKATAFGRLQELAGHFRRVVAKLIDELKLAGLEASRGQPGQPGGKTKVVAGHSYLEEEMKEPLSRLGVVVVPAMVYLGVDVQPRGRSAKMRQRQRFTRLAWRTKRLRQYRAQGRGMARGIKMVYKQGLKPGAAYGVKCLGMSDRQLQQLRMSAGRAIGGATQRSLTLQLAVAGIDPAHEVTAAPIEAWAAALWEGRVPRAWMRMAWENQRKAMGEKPSWGKVRGPAGATLMSCRRAGWTWPMFDKFFTRQGLEVDLATSCPRDVQAMAAKDAEAVRWKAWTRQEAYRQLAPAPLMDPLRSLRATRRHGWCRRARETLGKVVADGGWTQERLYKAGLVDEPTCLACRQEAGTLHHRWRCG